MRKRAVRWLAALIVALVMALSLALGEGSLGRLWLGTHADPHAAGERA